MIKYFCDICGYEVDSPSCFQEIKIEVEEEDHWTYRYSACNTCRRMLKEYINRLKKEANKNGTT